MKGFKGEFMDNLLHTKISTKLSIYPNIGRWLFLLFWCEYTIIYWISLFLGKIPLIGFIGESLFTILVAGALVICGKSFFKRIKLFDIFFFIAVLLVWNIQYIIHPSFQYFHEQEAMRCLSAFGLYFVGRFVAEEGIDSRLFNDLYKYSIAGLLLMIIYMFIGRYVDSSGAGGNMTLAYWILPSVLCVITKALSQPSLIRYTLSFIGLILLMFMGTRGAFLTAIVYASSYFIFFGLDNRKKQLICVISLIAITVLVSFVDFKYIMSSIFGPLASLLGVSDRIIGGFISGDVTSDNGRFVIYNELINRIYIDPSGYGLFSDRYYAVGNLYAHNFILEILMDFGIVIGLLFIFLYFYYSIKEMLNKKLPIETRYMICMLFTYCTVKLSVSSSWIFESYFYLLIGILLGTNYYKSSVNPKH